MHNEKILINRLKTGDEQAFNEIFHLHVRKVYHFILGYVKTKADAEDLTQVVFQKLWEKKCSVDPVRSFNGFIFTIAYNIIMDYFRKTVHSRLYIVDELPVTEPLTTDLTADAIINKHEFESVYEVALQSLTPKRRTIFVLSRHEGLSNKEIASRLNVSVKTVENQMTASLSILREFFSRRDLVSIAFVVYMSAS
jgi:RNA polymerase sigma-70 factor (ECF subfamily)